ncbi:hypothetical protein KDK95_14050 [Actinospica sp. MGRD01-02]|uniref:Cysteine-rich CPCC domain-containing protein n=1 Tax=Actinospica acidithermotolerans TaxID=2828514 RepID=A0A941E9F2_9ACTN|nr:CPCC family cysteine-rich protein [Actinospica acidithermotolerans]MBR7827436.1 hypothetical protein [Actinospica acidithermotolerans]
MKWLGARQDSAVCSAQANRAESGEHGFPCPCCGYLVFDEPPGSYEICPVCIWEDDLVQLRWPSYTGGANKPSLIDAQQNFKSFGASEQRRAARARPATAAEPLDPDWYLIEPSSLHAFEPVGEPTRPWPPDRTVLYWWRPTYWRIPPHILGADGGPAPLLREIHPDFSAELVSLLEAEGHTDLAVCAYDLRIIARCPCKDDFCQSFYTAPKPDGAYGPGHSNIPLFSNNDHSGMIVLDVVHGRIMFVEVLYYPPLRELPSTTDTTQ